METSPGALRSSSRTFEYSWGDYSQELSLEEPEDPFSHKDNFESLDILRLEPEAAYAETAPSETESRGETEPIHAATLGIGAEAVASSLVMLGRQEVTRETNETESADKEEEIEQALADSLQPHHFATIEAVQYMQAQPEGINVVADEDQPINPMPLEQIRAHMLPKENLEEEPEEAVVVPSLAAVPQLPPVPEEQPQPPVHEQPLQKTADAPHEEADEETAKPQKKPAAKSRRITRSSAESAKEQTDPGMVKKPKTNKIALPPPAVQEADHSRRAAPALRHDAVITTEPASATVVERSAAAPLSAAAPEILQRTKVEEVIVYVQRRVEQVIAVKKIVSSQAVSQSSAVPRTRTFASQPSAFYAPRVRQTMHARTLTAAVDPNSSVPRTMIERQLDAVDQSIDDLLQRLGQQAMYNPDAFDSLQNLRNRIAALQDIAAKLRLHLGRRALMALKVV